MAKAGDLFRTTGSGVEETTGEAPLNRSAAGVEEYAKLESDTAALETNGAGVEEYAKLASDTAAPDNSGAGVEDPIKAAGVDEA